MSAMLVSCYYIEAAISVHRDEIEAGSTVFKWLFSHRPEVGQEHVRGILGRMLFSGTDGEKPTGTLSGGEAARLSMS